MGSFFGKDKEEQNSQIHKPAEFKESKFKLHVAVDFGTAGCGIGFAYKDKVNKKDKVIIYNKWSSEVVNSNSRATTRKKIKTQLILNDKNEVTSFGTPAKFIYYNMEKEDRGKKKFFEKFKMALFEDIVEAKDDKKRDDINTEQYLIAIDGQKVLAKTVFIAAFQQLQAKAKQFIPNNVTEEIINDDEIQWIVTVPAIWSQKAKNNMKQWITDAGLVNKYILNQCVIVYGTDCASLSIQKQFFKDEYPEAKTVTGVIECNPTDEPEDDIHDNVIILDDQKLDGNESKFEEDDKYILIDAGGGIVDIACHKICSDGCVEEIVYPTGGNWGSIFVDELFIKLLEKMFGKPFIDNYKHENPAEFLDVMEQFELAKKTFYKHKHSKELPHRIKLPNDFMSSLYEKYEEVKKIVDTFAKSYKLKDYRNLFDCGKEYKSDEDDSVCVLRMIKELNKDEDSDDSDDSSDEDNDYKYIKYLEMDSKIWKCLFDSKINPIISHVVQLLDMKVMKHCKYLALVGGFSCSKYFQKRMKDMFGVFSKYCMNIIIPNKPMLSVVEGASYMAIRQDYIRARKLPFTYGLCLRVSKQDAIGKYELSNEYIKNNICNDGMVEGCFFVLGRKNERIGVNETRIISYRVGKTYSHVSIYRSTSMNPITKDDGECLAILQPKHFDEERENITEFHFHGTVLQVYSYPKTAPEKKQCLKIEFNCAYIKNNIYNDGMIRANVSTAEARKKGVDNNCEPSSEEIENSCEEIDRFSSELPRNDGDDTMMSTLSDDQVFVSIVDRNVIANAYDSLTKIRNSLELWESSMNATQSLPTQNIVSFGETKDQSTQTLPTNGDEKDNSEKNKEINNNENNKNNKENNDKNNQKQNNDEDEFDEHKNNDDCNIKWHTPTIMALQNKVQMQAQEIETLNKQLCKQKNWNTLMRIDVALNIYYKRCGIDSFFIQGNGKLSQFVINNMLNDDSCLLSNTLSGEFKKDNLLFAQFDKSFPFPSIINVQELINNVKEKIIFNIMQYCCRHNEPPSDEYIGRIYCNIKQQHKHKKCGVNDRQCLSSLTQFTENASLQEYKHDKQDDLSITHVAIPAVVYPKRLIKKKVIPTTIVERIVNPVDYMEKHIKICGENAFVESSDGQHAVFDFKFHCVKTKQPLYAIADKKKDEIKGEKWKLTNDLFYGSDIETKLKISVKLLKTQPICSEKVKFKDTLNKIKNMLQYQKNRHRITRCKYVKWETIPIHKKQSTSPLCLTMTNTEFSRRLQNNTNKINLVPIVTFTQDKCEYRIEIIWVVNIGHGNIGIALYLKDNKLIVSGIYLDIYDQHLLVPYKHECNCLEYFVCRIDDLTILIDSQTSRSDLIRENKLLQSKLKKTNEYIKQLEQLHEKDTRCLNKINNVLKQGHIQKLLQLLLQKQDQLQRQQDGQQQIINNLTTKMKSIPTSPNELVLQSSVSYNT